MDALSPAFLLQLAIATPLGAALLIALGLPKRHALRLAAVAFVLPALIALRLWAVFPAGAAGSGTSRVTPPPACRASASASSSG